MLRVAFLMTLLMLVAACDRAPAPSPAASQPFTVLSEQVDAAGNLIISIQLNQPVESMAQTIAESVIAGQRDNYRTVVVRSYLAGTTAGDTPYAVSTLENGAVSHKFNRHTASQKIPTH